MPARAIANSSSGNHTTLPPTWSGKKSTASDSSGEARKLRCPRNSLTTTDLAHGHARYSARVSASAETRPPGAWRTMSKSTAAAAAACDRAFGPPWSAAVFARSCACPGGCPPLRPLSQVGGSARSEDSPSAVPAPSRGRAALTCTFAEPDGAPQTGQPETCLSKHLFVSRPLSVLPVTLLARYSCICASTNENGLLSRRCQPARSTRRASWACPGTNRA